jgi:hypothetical protein
MISRNARLFRDQPAGVVDDAARKRKKITDNHRDLDAIALDDDGLGLQVVIDAGGRPFFVLAGQRRAEGGSDHLLCRANAKLAGADGGRDDGKEKHNRGQNAQMSHA